MSTVTNVQRGAQGFALLRRQTDESRESTPRQGKALRSAFHLCRVGTSQGCFDARRVIAISEKVGSAESGAKIVKSTALPSWAIRKTAMPPHSRRPRAAARGQEPRGSVLTALRLKGGIACTVTRYPDRPRPFRPMLPRTLAR